MIEKIKGVPIQHITESTRFRFATPKLPFRWSGNFLYFRNIKKEKGSNLYS